MNESELFPGFQGWVHDPLIMKDRYSVLTPRKIFNPQTVYRITWSTLPVTKYEDSTDVLAPYCHTTKNRHISDIGYWAFYEGAEEGLDRFLFWLHKSYLKNEYGGSPTLYVCRQNAADLQQELTPIYGKDQLLFIGPGQLEHFCLLFHTKGRDLSMF